jgi:hypothetical protein
MKLMKMDSKEYFYFFKRMKAMGQIWPFWVELKALQQYPAQLMNGAAGCAGHCCHEDLDIMLCPPMRHGGCGSDVVEVLIELETSLYYGHLKSVWIGPVTHKEAISLIRSKIQTGSKYVGIGLSKPCRDIFLPGKNKILQWHNVQGLIH